MNASNAASSRPVRPPFITATCLAGWVYATYWLSGPARQGNGLAAIGCLVAGWLALTTLLKALDDRVVIRDHRRRRQDFQNSAEQHGSARFARESEIEKAGLYGSSGIPLGVFPNAGGKPRYMFYRGECGISVFAPQGAAKSTFIGMGALFSDLNRSYVVNDPTGEYFAVTSSARSATNDIVVVCSAPDVMAVKTRRRIEDVGLNIFSDVSRCTDPAAIRDEVNLRTALVLPGQVEMKPADQHFLERGRLMISGFALLQLAEGKTPTLPQIRRCLMASREDLHQQFAVMATSDAFGGVLAEIGCSLGGTSDGASEEFTASLNTATRAVDVYDHFGSMGAHVSKRGFDPKRLKDRKPVTVYVMYPGDRQETHGAVQNTAFSYLIESAARDPRKRDVVFLMDEVGNMSYLPVLVRAMSAYRKSRIRCLLCWQSMSQVSRLYGENGLRDVLNLSEVLMAFGNTDPITLNTLSAMAGTTFIDDFSMNDRIQGQPMDHSLSSSHKSRPLLRPEEIRTLDWNSHLVFYRNLHPILARKLHYWDHPEWRKHAQPNPYYEADDDE